MGMFNPDNLVISTENSPITQGITLKAGTYKRGEVLGKDSSGIHGKIDGTLIKVTDFDCILCEELEITQNSKAAAYFTGEFRKSEIVKETAVTIEDIITNARDKGIFIK